MGTWKNIKNSDVFSPDPKMTNVKKFKRKIWTKNIYSNKLQPLNYRLLYRKYTCLGLNETYFLDDGPVHCSKSDMLFIKCVSGLTDAGQCHKYSIFGDTYYEYCAFGCCGYGSLEYCCSAVWPIIGMVVGMGVVVAVIVTIICCCRRSRGARGMVCQTNPRTNTTVVTAGELDKPQNRFTVTVYLL